MSNSGDTLDLTNGVEPVRRAASESLGLLKAATNFARGRQVEPAPVQPPVPPSVAVAANTARRRQGAPAASIISINVELAGTIVAPDELHIFGTVDGNVRAQSLTICAGGMVRGEVVAEFVTVHGTVEGRVHGQTVQICAGGVVKGDIIHAALGIDTAAIFEGSSKRTQNPMENAPAITIAKKAAE